MVCSCFVVALWKAGGLFGETVVNAVEFGPKDVYQLKVFDDGSRLPAECKA
jgi:hypothetical protein